MQDRTPSPWRYVALAALASMVAQSFGRFTYPLLLTAIQGDLGLTYTIAGSLASANLVAYMVGTLLVTWMATRWRPTRMIHLGMAVSALGLGLAAVARSAWVLAIALSITGLAGAIIWVPAPVVGSALLPVHQKGLGFGFVGSGIGVGVVISGFAAAELRSSLGDPAWRVLYRWEFFAALLLLALVLMWMRPTGASVAGGVKLSAIREVPGWRWLLWAYAIFAVCYSLFNTYLVAMLEDDRGFDPVLASRMFLILGAATVIGGPLSGKVSDAIGRPRTMLYGFLLMAAAALLVRWGPFGVVVPATIAFGFGFSGVPASIGAHIGDHTRLDSFAAAFGFATLAFGVAQMIAPQVGGILADELGSFDMVFLLSAVTGLIGAWMAIMLLRRAP